MSQDWKDVFAPPLPYSWSADVRRIGGLFIPLVLLGFVTLLIHSGFTQAATTFFVWGLACLASGYVLGFLFGIPKILQINISQDPKQQRGAYRQEVNTNLEQISDWLTKIIIGLGLINLQQIPSYLNKLTTVLSSSVAGASTGNRAICLATIVYFSVIGFICGYLFTRLFLAGAFSRADQESASAAIRDVRTWAKDLEPDLLKQVLLNTSTNTLIDGESFTKSSNDSYESYTDERDSGVDETEKLDIELDKLRKDKGIE